MNTMTESPAVRRINQLLSTSAAKIARHIPSNHNYQVILEIPGAGVELRADEGNERIETWAAWMNSEIWSKPA